MILSDIVRNISIFNGVCHGCHYLNVQSIHSDSLVLNCEYYNIRCFTIGSVPGEFQTNELLRSIHGNTYHCPKFTYRYKYAWFVKLNLIWKRGILL